MGLVYRLRDWVAKQLRTKVEPTGKTPGRQTVVNALNLLRVALEQACQTGVLEQNPANGVRVPRVARTKEAWTWLRTEEIGKLLGENVDVGPRCVFAFAIFTGLRAGEIFGLKWSDIDRTRNVASICRSWKDTPTKRGETREVHLFGAASEALKEQRARKLPGPYVFPDEQGRPRSKNHKPDLDKWLHRAGVKRHVRFHDLRHTCASHLVSGSWGRAWTLEEVAKHLGHSSSAVTRRYAHLCPEGLKRAVRETRPELQMKLIRHPRPSVPSAGPISGPTWSQAAGSEFASESANYAKLEEEKGFEPLVEFTPTAVFKTVGGLSDRVGLRADGHGVDTGGVREAAIGALERMRAGVATTGEVAKLAAEVLGDPPAVMVAARRYLNAVGTEHEGAAAVAFLALLTGDQVVSRAAVSKPLSEGPETRGG